MSKKISCEEAAQHLYEHINTCDNVTLADIYTDIFGLQCNISNDGNYLIIEYEDTGE